MSVVNLSLTLFSRVSSSRQRRCAFLTAFSPACDCRARRTSAISTFKRSNAEQEESREEHGVFSRRESTKQKNQRTCGALIWARAATARGRTARRWGAAAAERVANDDAPERAARADCMKKARERAREMRARERKQQRERREREQSEGVARLERRLDFLFFSTSSTLEPQPPPPSPSDLHLVRTSISLYPLYKHAGG